ncbi:sensor histidine kinase [Streptosporangium saharense]|uniref:sensor histidine kinase n=1 Tax=Streptosporangium saharense TaxID=1706840 RepID=UPI00341B8752
MTAPIPEEVLENWADRWRYPMTVVHPDRLFEGILHGLELGLTTPAESANVLISDGYFAAADQLFDSDNVSVLIERKRVEALVEVSRRRSILAGRANRVDLSPAEAPDPESVARDNLPQARALLDQWESQITAAENHRRDDLRKRAAGLPAERQEAVDQCLKRSAFDAAELLIRSGGGLHLDKGPGSVPRRSRWPYSRHDLDKVLAWYRTGADPSAGFGARWRPHPDDQPARELIAAYTDLLDVLDEDRALRFIKALDDVLEGGGDHSTVFVGEAVSSAISGLREPQLPVLGLPTPMPVWLSRSDHPPPDDFSWPALWVVLGEPPRSAPGRVAMVTPAMLFELAAPGPDGQRPQAAARRVAFLRAVCAQLTLADLLPSGRPDGSRWQIAWILDLLGVLTADAAIDILLHDTSGLPVALGVAMRHLFDDVRQRELTADSLAGWRTDREHIARFSAEVMGELADEPDVSSVLYAALHLYHEYGIDCFDAGQAEEAVRDLVESNADITRVPLFPDLPRVLNEATETKLIRHQDGLLHLISGGLPRLLTSDTEATQAAARRVVQRLIDQRARLADRLMLRAVQEAIDHLQANSFMAFRSLVTSLEDYRHTLPDEVGDRVTETISQFRQFDSYHRIATDQTYEQVTKPEKFDVVVLLLELAQKRSTSQFRILVNDDNSQPSPVWANRLLVSMAVDNLLSNARRAILEDGRIEGQVRLRVRTENESTVIDVEDSGPGVAYQVREQLFRGEVASLSGGGRGLPDARTLLGYYGGTVRLLPETSDLGGAWFRISLSSFPRAH